MAYKYEESNKQIVFTVDNESSIDELNKRIKELQEVYRKAQAFDNYMVDLAKTIETFPHDYIKNDNFIKETSEFYMQSKEDFIKAYENEVSRKHGLIRDAAEYDEIIGKVYKDEK